MAEVLARSRKPIDEDAIADYLAVVNKRVQALNWREVEVNSQLESAGSIPDSDLASPPAKA